MEFSFPLALTVVSLNLAIIAINYLLQQVSLEKKEIAPRNSIIPGTNQKFLHWQDFYAQKWGDTIFLNGMFVAFWHIIIFTEAVSLWFCLIFIIVMALDCFFFLKMCVDGKNHKHDWGFPEAGAITGAGFFHGLYHGFGVATALLCITLILLTDYFTGWTLWSFWIGVVGYLACFLADITAGHFDPLKKIS